MRTPFLLVYFVLMSFTARSAGRDSTIHYLLPDSVNAVQFIATIKVESVTAKKEAFAGIQTDIVHLRLEWEKSEKEIVFGFPASAAIMATGNGIRTDEKGELVFSYNWSEGEAYSLLIATASDSAGNFSLYSGYVFLPREKKWKLIGTCKISGRWNTIQQPSLSWSTGRKGRIRISSGETWCQRANGSWKNMKEEKVPAPVINLFGHADSVQQHQADIALIEEALQTGKTDASKKSEGIYYTMLKEGSGRPVYVTDTVTVHYKGYLLSDGSIFDQTRENPATFPLKRLIRGWQVGVPLCKVGGKIKLVIPSDLAYSIRTRAAKIPPNSILVFEIEVLKVKAPEEVQ